jgi:hypothetical protein
MRRSPRTAVVVAIAALALSACGSHSNNNVTETAASSNPGGAAGNSSHEATHDSMAGGHSAAAEAKEGDGLTNTVGGYSLVNVTRPTKAGHPGTMTFVINGPQGKPQKDFTLQQTKLLHLYVVRQDLTEFQHIHPALNTATGKWSVPVTFAKPGPYHMVTEFEALKADGNFDDRILGADFKVGGGAYRPVTYTSDFGKASVDGYQLTLDPNAKVSGPDLHLKITKNGSDVTDLAPYLESFAHITGFRSGDLKAVHVHPEEVPAKNDPHAHGGPVLTVSSLFAAPGKYRMFIEFQTNGQVHLAPVDVDVS